MSKHQNSDRVLIYKFLNNTLNANEKKIFASKQQEAQFSELLAEIITEQKGRIELRKKLKTISQQQNKTLKTKKSVIRFSVASSAIAAILIIGLFLFNTDDTSDLFNHNFEPFPNVYAVKGFRGDESPLLKDALQLYDQEVYDEAVLIFEKLNDNELKGYIRLYYSIALLAVNDIETSQQTLGYISHNDPAYAEGQWYLALAYLKQDSTKQAIPILKNIQPYFGKKKQLQIEELIEKINRLKLKKSS